MEPLQLELHFGVGNLFGLAPAPPEERSRPEADCRDEELTRWCAEAARGLGLARLARRVEVQWNRRLKTTAGLADSRAWRVELNPRLLEFRPEEPMRTLRHELAHLVAQARAGRRRIATHGREWRLACVELGIPGEKACHSLPLPRSRMRKRWAYSCPSCGTVLERVRRIRYVAACAECCRQHNRGSFSKRYRLVEAELGP